MFEVNLSENRQLLTLVLSASGVSNLLHRLSVQKIIGAENHRCIGVVFYAQSGDKSLLLLVSHIHPPMH